MTNILHTGKNTTGDFVFNGKDDVWFNDIIIKGQTNDADGIVTTYSTIYTYGGNDFVTTVGNANASDTNKETVYAGDGNDTVYSYGNDKIYGENGDDKIIALGDNTEAYGGFGNDFITSDGSYNKIYGEEGNDILYDNNGGAKLTGGSGNDLFATTLNSSTNARYDTTVITDFEKNDSIGLNLKPFTQNGVDVSPITVNETNFNLVKNATPTNGIYTYTLTSNLEDYKSFKLIIKSKAGDLNLNSLNIKHFE